MDNKKIISILKIFINKTKDKKINWRLGGSLNMKIQGMNISEVQDIDITTNNQGFKKIKKIFSEHVISEHYKGNWKGNSLILNIKRGEIEIFCFDNDKFNYINKIRKVNWKRLTVPILPLKYHEELCRAFNKIEKADWIKEFLLKNIKQ